MFLWFMFSKVLNSFSAYLPVSVVLHHSVSMWSKDTSWNTNGSTCQTLAPTFLPMFRHMVLPDIDVEGGDKPKCQAQMWNLPCFLFSVPVLSDINGTLAETPMPRSGKCNAWHFSLTLCSAFRFDTKWRNTSWNWKKGWKCDIWLCYSTPEVVEMQSGTILLYVICHPIRCLQLSSTPALPPLLHTFLALSIL